MERKIASVWSGRRAAKCSILSSSARPAGSAVAVSPCARRQSASCPRSGIFNDRKFDGPKAKAVRADDHFKIDRQPVCKRVNSPETFAPHGSHSMQGIPIMGPLRHQISQLTSRDPPRTTFVAAATYRLPRCARRESFGSRSPDRIPVRASNGIWQRQRDQCHLWDEENQRVSRAFVESAEVCLVVATNRLLVCRDSDGLEIFDRASRLPPSIAYILQNSRVAVWGHRACNLRLRSMSADTASAGACEILSTRGLNRKGFKHAATRRVAEDPQAMRQGAALHLIQRLQLMSAYRSTCADRGLDFQCRRQERCFRAPDECGRYANTWNLIGKVSHQVMFVAILPHGRLVKQDVPVVPTQSLGDEASPDVRHPE